MFNMDVCVGVCVCVRRHAVGFGHVTDGVVMKSAKYKQRVHVSVVTLLVCKVFVGKSLEVEPGDGGRLLTRAPEGFDSVRQPYSFLADTHAYGVYAHSQAQVAYMVTLQLVAPCFVDGSCCEPQS
jgi:hypothetical protein